MKELRFPSGLVIQEPLGRLLRFCREEYEYYDAVPPGHPNRIEPLDILATVGINSRIDTAAKVRTVHRGMSEATNALLERIPADAQLQSFGNLDLVHELFAAAMTTKFVLLATATKVLHRKRTELIPIMDSVVVGHYVRDDATEKALLQRSWENRTAAADIGRLTVERLREDLIDEFDAVDALRQRLGNEGFHLSHVRITDILVWTERELAGSYRSA